MPEKEKKTRDITKIRRRRKVMKYLYLGFLLFLVLYVPGVLLASGGAGADVAIIGNGTITDSIHSKGLVVRDEMLFKLPFDGVHMKEAGEGERVPAGYKIASVVDSSFESKFREMELLEAEILSRKKNGEIESGIFTKDLLQVEEHIRAGVQEIASMVAGGDIENLDYIMSDIRYYSAYRDEIISGSTSPDAYTSELETQYNVLRQSLDDKVVELFTAEPGYISYWIDGYEEKFNTENITGTTVDDLKDAIKQGGDKNAAQESRAFARMSTGNYYTIAFVLKEKTAEKIEAGGTVEIRIESMGISFDSSQIMLGEKSGGEVCVYITTNRKLNELASVRTVDAEIVFYEYSGLIVPVKSLLNMEAYPIRAVELARVRDNWVHFIEVEVIAEDGTNAIISSPEGELHLFDYYALRPKKVEEGEVVK